MRRIFQFGWSILLFVTCFAGAARAQNINISLVAQHEPPNSGIAFGDVWAEGDIACLGIWTGYNNYGVGIYNIANPAVPVLQSIYTTTPTNHNQFELGVVRNRIGYFGSWSSGGVHIVSLTNPASPLFLSKIGSTSGGFDKVHTVFLERNFLYEAAHVTGENKVKVIDVSDPFAPFFVRNIVSTNASKVHQITAVKKGTRTILYTSDFGNGGSSPGETDIWDVTDVGAQPAVWMGRILSGASSHSSWPTSDGNTLVVCRETTGGEVKLYDISNPASPVLQSTISPTTMGLEVDLPHNPVVVSNLLFVSWYQNGLQIFDITDRTKPVRVGSYDTYLAARTSNFQGNWGVFPDLGLNRLLLSDIQTGLYIVDASAVLTATNNYPPLLIAPAQPTSQTTTQGMTATLSAVFTGSSPKYQWRTGATSGGTAVAGATNSSLVISNVQTSHSTNYFVIATNFTGSVTSSAVSLSVVVPSNSVPTITAQPQPVSVYPDSPATFSIAVSGAAPFGFQWKFGGADISGATNSSLTISNVQAEHVGNYSVLVTNAFGAATSSNAMLSITDSPFLNSILATAGARSALVSWKSTIPSDSLVQFSVANQTISNPAAMSAMSASFSSSSYIDRTISTNHTILLTGLTPDTLYSYQVISTAGTNSYVSGVYQFTTAGTVIVDNPDAVFTGNWIIGTNSTDRIGVNYHFATSGAGASAATSTFRPNLATSGKYEVHVYYPQGSNRANNAPYTISSTLGNLTVPVNQQSGGGTWQKIVSGRDFTRGTNGNVQLANNANPSVVMADAVRFTYLESQESTIDEVPTWWENFYFVTNINPLADHDGDGYPTAEEYILGTSPTDGTSSLQLELQASGSSANITFHPYIGNRNYQLLFKTNISDSNWEVLSLGSITPTPYGHGIFSVSAANIANGFYRLSVQPVPEGNFSGKTKIAQGDAFVGFSEAACGVNRVYVVPAGGK